MVDIVTKATRSRIMASVKGSETQPEVLVRKFLFSKGFRYRKNLRALPGKPDIVLAKYKTVILIHGCFWHGHKNCKDATLPKSRIEYWKPKIEGNVKRDCSKKLELKKLGWKVIEIWTCQLHKKKLEGTLQRLIRRIIQ